MADQTTQLIKEKLDIAQFLKGYLELQPAGKNFKARCPFHQERTPSFIVSPDRQSWHCFGCGLGGDVFAFVMRQENIEFPDALRLLAEKAGVELRRINPAQERIMGVLYDINAAAADFFGEQLAADPFAQEYLAKRGLTPETARTFQIGYAPHAEEALTVHLLKKDYRPDDIIRAGLAFMTDRGMRLDRFRGRIMFPIQNHLGKVVGFSGRILPQFDTGTMGKYVNTPETPLFVKSKILYGFPQAKQAIRDTGVAVLVEGQMDLVMLHQDGARNVVAVSGTALTREHLRALRKQADRIVLALDGDAAGWQATERAAHLAAQEDFEVSVLHWPGVKDAADFVKEHPGTAAEIVTTARPAIAATIDHYLVPTLQYAERDGLRALRHVLGAIAALPSPVAREHWIGTLVNRTNLSARVLAEELELIIQSADIREEVVEQVGTEAAASDDTTMAGSAAAPVIRSRWELVAERLIAAAFHTSSYDQIERTHLPPHYLPVLTMLSEGAKTSDDQQLDALMRRIIFVAQPPTAEEVPLLLEQVAREYASMRRLELTQLIRTAEGRGDEAAAAAALTELAKLPKR